MNIPELDDLLNWSLDSFTETAGSLGWETGFDDLRYLTAGSGGVFSDTRTVDGSPDWGGLTFRLDPGREATITSQWFLAPGASGAIRVISDGQRRYLYEGGQEHTYIPGLGLTISMDTPVTDEFVVRGQGRTWAERRAAEQLEFRQVTNGISNTFAREAGVWAAENMTPYGTYVAVRDAIRDPSAGNLLNASLSVLPMTRLAGRLLPNNVGRATGVADDAPRMPGGGRACFVAGTLVQTRVGLKAIEDIKVGDFVLSRPERDGETGYRRVNEIFRFADKVIWEIAVATPDGRTERYRATGNHPFWVEGLGWTAVEYLEAGQTLRLSDGSAANVVYAENTRRPESVFNFEVDGWHTYHVGDLGVWVHNRNCWGELPDNIRSDLRSLGIDESRYSLNGSALDLDIRMIGEADPARSGALRRVMRHLQAEDSGLTAINVRSGPVVNPNLAARLASRAEAGQTYLGMRVQRLSDQWSGTQTAPAFLLQWWR